MNLQKLNKICFTICIVCIVLGIILALAMIWIGINNYSDFLWKLWATLGVVFLGSTLTLSVSKALGKHPKDKDEN